MKHFRIKIVLLLTAAMMVFPSCMDDLLNQPSRNELPASAFWKTVDDADYALNGAIGDIRYLFNRDYYLEGRGEFVHVAGNSPHTGNAVTLYGGQAYEGTHEYKPTGYGTQADRMYMYCFGGVNRANYVIDGVEKMVAKESNPTTKARLESIIGEAKLLRALVYHRLISWWGDVPYINQRVYSNVEVASLPRTPIAEIVPKLIEDLTYAFDKLPVKAPGGRISKTSALALRGKIELYWACWNNFGWPELDTFTPSADEAAKAYRAAAADFRSVIDDYGLTLYKNGEPGDSQCNELGQAENLPNYYYLFTPLANGDPEFIIAFNHGGPGTGQSEELMRDMAGRSIESSQAWVVPRVNVIDRYQSLETGDFCPPLELMPPEKDNRTKPNASVNPQSFANRDYRLKSSILWDYEMSAGLAGTKATGWVPFIFLSYGTANFDINGVKYTTYMVDGPQSLVGHVFRKFVRNYAGQARSEGNYNWPVIRLADVYLMYAEAVNEANITGEKEYAIAQVNKVRHRGNLPPLTAAKTATKDEFFKAIEQERIVELLGEGHRNADLRRWRAIERTFAPPGDPNGVKFYSLHGNQFPSETYFQNQNEVAYQRAYIFCIPPSERDRNPNLTQNKPYR